MPDRKFGLLYWQEVSRLGILVGVWVGIKGDGRCGEELWSLFLLSRDGVVLWNPQVAQQCRRSCL